MTDQEAIEMARRYGLCRWFPVVRIPPLDCIDEVTTVEWRRNRKPLVARAPTVHLS